MLVLRTSLSSAAQLDQSRACFSLTDPLTGSLAAPIIVAQLEGAGRAYHIERVERAERAKTVER
jgi:hypothetical protein